MQAPSPLLRKDPQAPTLKTMYIASENDIRTLKRTTMKAGQQLDVWGYGSVESALTMLQIKVPDVIIVDVGVLDVSVQKTLRHIRRHSDMANSPVILLTVSPNPHEVQDYYAMGIAGVLLKPIDTLILMREVVSLWGTYQMLNRRYF